MAEMPQSYRDYLEDVSRQVRWLDCLRFRRAIRQAIPGLVQQGAVGETVLSVLASDFYLAPSPTRMDNNGGMLHDAAEHCISSSMPTGRCLLALTSHNLHVFPFRSPTITTFTPDQILPLWRFNNALRTIEIPFVPAEAVRSHDGDDARLKALVLRVDQRDWATANRFLVAGLAATAHWGDPAAIVRQIETIMQNIGR